MVPERVPSVFQSSSSPYDRAPMTYTELPDPVMATSRLNSFNLYVPADVPSVRHKPLFKSLSPVVKIVMPLIVIKSRGLDDRVAKYVSFTMYVPSYVPVERNIL